MVDGSKTNKAQTLFILRALHPISSIILLSYIYVDKEGCLLSEGGDRYYALGRYVLQYHDMGKDCRRRCDNCRRWNSHNLRGDVCGVAFHATAQHAFALRYRTEEKISAA